MLGEIKSSVDDMKHFNIRTTEKFDNDDKRIRDLQDINNQAIGKHTVISAIFGFVGGIVTLIVGTHYGK